ncbi:MAG: hypothetical protein Q4P17_10285 [Methanobacterium sp.]|nr:hypothetical protein [Methanobacterium sp.]
MKRSTPVIIGLLLILGVVALGYFAESNNGSNNTTNNNSSQYTLLKKPSFTDQTQPSSPVESQQTPASDVTANNNTQNNTQNQTTVTQTPMV